MNATVARERPTVLAMRRGIDPAMPLLRRLVLAAVVALGVVTVVGSGGGAIGLPSDAPTFDPGAIGLSVSVFPGRQIVQAGTTAKFEAFAMFANGPVSYQWRRDGVDIAGATASVYTLNGVQLADDGAVFQVVASAPNGSSTAGGTLLVSPLPPLVFGDGNFPVAAWTVSAAPFPAQDGPTYAIAQALDGGDPGAFRRITNQMTAGASALQIDHLSAASTYDPRTQGAIYTIGLASECIEVSRAAGVVTQGTPLAVPMFAQAGRTYRPREWYGYCRAGWQGDNTGNRTADAFIQDSGPPCGPAEACPDFSATAPPLRIGFTSDVATAAGSATGTIVVGVDNWQTTIWRK
jgi:hypothetical protein